MTVRRGARSFDLQLARQGLQDPVSRPRPHHGTAQCTWQYLVCLLHRQGSNPAPVFVQGYDNQAGVYSEADHDEQAQLLRQEITQRFLIPMTSQRILGSMRNDDAWRHPTTW